MELPLAVVSDCQQRAVIRFLSLEGRSVSEIHEEMLPVYGEKTWSIERISQWLRDYEEGRETVHHDDDEVELRSGRPSASTEKEPVEAVRKIVLADRKVSIDNIVAKLSHRIGLKAVTTVLKDKLGYFNICGKWVEAKLIDQHKKQRLDAARRFTEMFTNESESIFDRIVTGGETWIDFPLPDNSAKKSKLEHTKGKIMVTVFWDSKGVLLVDFLPRGEIITGEKYRVLLKNLRTVLRRKRRGTRREKIFIHDSVGPHSEPGTKSLVRTFDWDDFCIQPCSPDLNPSDFYIFPALEAHLQDQQFSKDEAIRKEANRWLQEKDSQWYNEGLQELTARLRKCIEVQGDYVEKQKD
uniref:Mariner Mos1 transposase n=1 Tax=Lygus hesperus TaxID=30085 RepID=A0A0A9XWE4_LYGHE